MLLLAMYLFSDGIVDPIVAALPLIGLEMKELREVVVRRVVPGGVQGDRL